MNNAETDKKENNKEISFEENINLHADHRKRVRKEFLSNGVDNWPEHKILEMLLFYCIPRRDTNELAHILINKYKNLAGVLDAPADELMKFSGITENNVVLIKLITPILRRYQLDKHDDKPNFNSVEEIGDYLLKRYFGFTEEVFGILCLDPAFKYLDFKILGEGDINSVGVSTRNVAEIALSSNAAYVVMAHNHPSQVALPSSSDIAITKQVTAALAHIDIKVFDHIIIADDDYISMRQSNNFKNIFT